MRHVAENADALYRGVLHQLLDRGDVASPRGKVTRECIGAHLTLLDPNRNVVIAPERRLNYSFMVAEWLWMMSGSNSVHLIEPFNRAILMAADKEQSFAFMGAYGPKIVEQLPYVVSALKQDPSSRQAVISIWRERPRASNDIPCTVSMQFIARGGKLTMLTNMRSNDAWLGLPYDLFNFTQMQRYVAALLGYDVGPYHHFVGSLHLYEENAARAREVLADDVLHESPSHHPLDPHGLRDALVAFMRLATAVSGTGSLSHPDREALARGAIDDYLTIGPWGDLMRVLARKFVSMGEYTPTTDAWEHVLSRQVTTR